MKKLTPMPNKTKIECTDAVWNPTTGCTKISPGCANCYAERMAQRLQAMGQPNYKDGFQLTLHPDALTKPLHWAKPRRIFVNSMSDLFHEAVPDAFIDQVFAIMALSPQHTFQILTKRPERMAGYTNNIDKRFGALNDAAREVSGRDSVAIFPTQSHGMVSFCYPFPNVWLGTSIEAQATADERIPHLLRCNAAVRFLSCEPLLGPIDFGAGDGCDEWWQSNGIDWVIVGGESGPSARSCDIDWIRSIVRQCRAVGVPPFVKQLGAKPRWDFVDDGCIHPIIAIPSDRKGVNMDEWPADLRIRQYPRPRS